MMTAIVATPKLSRNGQKVRPGSFVLPLREVTYVDAEGFVAALSLDAYAEIQGGGATVAEYLRRLNSRASIANAVQRMIRLSGRGCLSNAPRHPTVLYVEVEAHVKARVRQHFPDLYEQTDLVLTKDQFACLSQQQIEGSDRITVDGIIIRNRDGPANVSYMSQCFRYRIAKRAAAGTL